MTDCPVCHLPATLTNMARHRRSAIHQAALAGGADPTIRPSGQPPVPVEQRFWAKVEKTPKCWLWRGAVTGSGYGKLILDGRTVNAHRVSLELALGRPLAPGMDACHTCDTSLCVRPDHLFEGSRAANVDDMRQKGRGWWQRTG